MPSTSSKQEAFFRAVANSSKFAHKVGVPQSVGKDFQSADQAKENKSKSPRLYKKKTGN